MSAQRKRKPGQHTGKKRAERANLLNYPRRGKTGFARWIPSFRLIAVGALSLLFLAVAGFTVAYALTEVPEPNPEASGETSTVYFDDGETVLGTFKDQNRKLVSIDEISEPMQAATVAAEDRTFYENRGISLTGLSRAVVGVVTDDYAGGGSTITQQYVKNFYLTNERSLDRKVREMFIALKIDEQQSKDEVLANYLNTIYLGRQTYGVEVAAQEYFDKPASELDVAESALFAAMIQRPGAGDPAENPEIYADRFDYVIQGMVEEGAITAEEAAGIEMPEVAPKKVDANEYAGTNGYLLEAVRSELENTAGLEPQNIDRGGLTILTTYNKDKMKALEEAVAALPENKPDGLRVAATSIDPETGGVVAMYGGEDYLERQRNAATQDSAQAGSAFKPFALVAGFENGVRLTDVYNGNSPLSPKGWGGSVQNFGNGSYGTVSLLRATQQSMNTPYAALSLQVTPQKVADAADRAGIPASVTETQKTTPSIVLGTPSPTNLQMTSAYATFAANGAYRTPHVVAEVKDTDDQVIHEADTEGDQRFDEAVMAETSYALSQVVQGGTGTYARQVGRPVAGKTGTSSSNYSAWFSGYTPNLATSVSMYRQNDAGDPVPIGAYGGRGEVTGGSFPIQVWTDYMIDALEDEPVKQFPERGELPQVDKPANPDQPPSPRPSAPRGNSGGDDDDETARPEESEEPDITQSPDSDEGDGDDGGSDDGGSDDGGGDSGGGDSGGGDSGGGESGGGNNGGGDSGGGNNGGNNGGGTDSQGGITAP